MEELVVSKVRVKILQLFLSSQENLYHVREIVRRVDEEINAVRRELARLEKYGMVASEWRANRRLYRFKKEYKFYPELLAMVAKTTGLGGDILVSRARLGRIKYAMMALRFVKNQISGPEEVDVLLVGQIVGPELQSVIANEQTKREGDINYTFMDETEFAFRVRRRDPFILKVLVQPKIMLVGDESEMLEGVLA